MANEKKVMMEVPADLADAVKRVGEVLERSLAEIRRESGFDWEKISRAVEVATSEIEREATRRLLQECDVDADAIRINGKRHSRVGRYEAPYFTKAGEVRVVRSLYREDGKRNAKTVDTVTLKVGAIDDGWLPEAVRAMAFLVQQTTSREAEAAAKKLGRLPYSRSSFERVTHQLGTLHSIERSRVEDVLMENYEVPAGAVSVSAQLDRFALAMEEPQPRPVGRPKKTAPKRFIAVKWRMAFSGTVTLHDRNGEALATIRHGEMPSATADEVAQGLAEDVRALLKKKPRLKVVRLADGGGDVSDALARNINREVLGVDVADLVDIWHVVEKLGAAAQVIYGNRSTATVESWKLRLLNSRHAHGQIYEALRASGKEDHCVGREQPVHDAMTYLVNQAGRMNYVDARKAGLPIGSGVVEANCKSLSHRMRRTGARWLDETGQHIIDLRALALSDRFDAAIGLTLAPLRATVRRAA